MHYKNGRAAQNGDKVLVVPSYGLPYVGILYDAVAGNDYCNGKVALTALSDPCPNLKECIHLDDALAAFKSYEAHLPTLEELQAMLDEDATAPDVVVNRDGSVTAVVEEEE